MRPPRRYAYSSEPVNGTSFGKMISPIIIIKELEIILDDQASHTEERHKHKEEMARRRQRQRWGSCSHSQGKKRISKATSSKEGFCPCPMVVREILAL